tara:strand:+ start:52 stop:243 length:192 start_codon:yes stop_codon:yes gene_type:complete
MTNERLDKLETKSVYQEDFLERLSSELRTQQKEIIALKEELKFLKDSLQADHLEEGNQKPPHY